MFKKIGLVTVTVLLILAGLVVPVYAQTTTTDDVPPTQGDIITQLAEAAGMTRDEFLEELQSGKTTQEVLEENGISNAALIMMRQEAQRTPAERLAITTLTELLGMSRAEFYQALVDGYTINALLESEGLMHEDFVIAYQILAEDQIIQALEDEKISEDKAETMLEKINDDELSEQWLLRMDRIQVQQLMKQLQSFGSAERLAPILEMGADEIKQALREGKMLADIIEDAGMDEQDVLEDLIGTALAEVQDALVEGKITASQAERMTELMQTEDFGQAAWNRLLSMSFSPRDVAARNTLNQMHQLVEKFHNQYGR